MDASDNHAAEILPPGVPGGEQARRVRGPGWVSRNRETLAAMRRLGGAVVMVAPPPARVPLALACLAIDGALWAEEARRGARDGTGVALGGAGLALEAAALAAAMASAPVALARHAPQLIAARRLVAGLEARRR